MRNGRTVLDPRDLETGGAKRSYRSFPAGPGALDPGLDLLHPHREDITRYGLGRLLRSEGRTLPRALVADFSRAAPRDHGTFTVRYRYDGIVERRLHMDDAVRVHLFLFLLFRLLRTGHLKPP